jgi:hypothetical protein
MQFATDKTALDFIAGRITAEAEREGTPLTEIFPRFAGWCRFLTRFAGWLIRQVIDYKLVTTENRHFAGEGQGGGCFFGFPEQAGPQPPLRNYARKARNSPQTAQASFAKPCSIFD